MITAFLYMLGCILIIFQVLLGNLNSNNSIDRVKVVLDIITQSIVTSKMHKNTNELLKENLPAFFFFFEHINEGFTAVT